jgi:hypothetical protein
MRLCVLAILVVLGAVGQGAAQKPPPMKGKTPPFRILVPAYFYPGGDANLKEWQKLAAAAGLKARVPIIAIINPSSGPGKKLEPNYSAVIRAMNKAGVTTIGYVSTSFGKRPGADVEADFKTWRLFYPEIKGFFLDEQASDADSAKLYVGFCQSIRKRTPKSLIVSNPGTICDQAYFAKDGPDVICVHENGNGLKTYNPPAWLEKQTASRVAALTYSQDKEAMPAEVALAKKKGIGCVFVTDEKLPNPWAKLPSYWGEFVKKVR